MGVRRANRRGTGHRPAAAIALALVTILLLAGCGGDPEPPRAAPTSTSADPAPSSSSGSPTVPAIDPALAVDPPGRRTQPLHSADLLVFSQRSLSAAMVRRIRRLRGVVYTASFSLAQATVENRAVNVAAVDPATYRLFTAANVADTLAVWKRVAGGELAIRPRLGRRLADDQQMIRLGVSADAPDIHVGAYADQVVSVDAVVNQKWGERLGMPEGNALLISTGIASPSSLRPAIERIAGRTASVQSLDAVARFGLDTSVKQTAFLTGGTVAGVVGTFNYTVVGGGRIAPEASWVRAHISTRQMPILGPMTCNTAMFPQLEAALREILESHLADRLHPGEYAGCYYPRFIAGTTILSNHSFGLAFDVNVPGNQRGTVGEIDRRVVAIFEKWGFAWGGTWRYTDPMHFEMNRIVEPR